MTNILSDTIGATGRDHKAEQLLVHRISTTITGREGEPTLFFQRMVGPCLQFVDRMGFEKVKAAPTAGNFPSRCLGTFFAEFERKRICGLGPRATHARKAIWLVLVKKDPRAANGDALPRKASTEGLD